MTENDYEVSPFESRSLGSEPGLLITNTVAKLSKNRRVPLLLINTTNKTLSIKPGTPTARISPVSVLEITYVHQTDKIQIGSITDNNEFDKVNVPSEHRS